MADLFCHLVKPASHETLNAHDGIVRVSNGLAFSRVAHFTFAVFQKSHYRRGGTASLIIGNYHRFISFHYCHAAVGGTEVNSYYLSHIAEFNVPLWLSMIMPR